MKSLRLIFLSLLVLGVQPAFAADSLLSSDAMNYIGYGAIFLTMLVILIALLMVQKALKMVSKSLLGPEGVAEEQTKRKAARANWWNKLMSLKPMSEEQTLVMEGEYDGIKELNNPTPAWFMVLFYITIGFAVVYLLIYHVFNAAPLQYDEYKNEVAIAAKEKAAFEAKAGGKIDENTVKFTTDPAVLAAGKAVFAERCVACHGQQGQGMPSLGPNLTDDYWLHGNKIGEIFKTVKEGVPSKGMPTWGTMISPKQISEVANFIKSLHDTHPSNPKEPQGVKLEDDDSAKPAEKPSKTAMVAK